VGIAKEEDRHDVCRASSPKDLSVAALLRNESFEQRMIYLVLSFMTDFLRLHIELPFIESEWKRSLGL
jgi:hypothetical protein